MELASYLDTFPRFLAYLATAFLMATAFITVYCLVTPHREIALIRTGNAAATLSLGGALIGFVLPLGSVIAHSLSLADVAIWGLVALAVQLLAFLATRLMVPDLGTAIGAGNLAVGGFAGAVALAAGILNAACMTW